MSETRTAVVTGSTSGIGLGIARALAAKGMNVMLNGFGEPAEIEKERKAIIDEFKVEALYSAADMTKPKEIVEMVKRAETELGTLDVLVNNAGIATGYGAPPSAEPLAAMKAVYEVNVFGPVRVTQAFLPLLRKSPAARIVMMSSGLGSLGLLSDPAGGFYDRNFLAYNSSKTALNAVTLAFAKELAPLGIKVNAADPGYTATDLNGHRGVRTVEQGAEIAVRLAMLGGDGPTAGYFNDEGAVPW